MNKVILSGYLTHDTELFQQDKLLISKYSLGVQRQVKSKEGNYDTDFINCIQFNPNDYIKDNLIKGSKVLVEGRLQTRQYTDNKGNKRTLTEVLVERIEILKKSENKPQEAKESTQNPFEEFGQQFEAGHQIEIDEESDLPF